MTAMPAIRALALAASLIACLAHAQGEDALANLINDYRAAPETCEGNRMPMTGALAPSDELARVQVALGANLEDALREVGYLASRTRMISVQGPARAASVMTLLQSHYCRDLLDPRYSEIGISHDRATWRILLAHPLVAADLGDWREAGKAVLELVNAARAEPRTCGKRRFDATGSLVWNEKLAAASLAHSRDMAQENYFSHAAKDGDTPADRARRQGYRWQRIGENIAAGQGSAKKAVAAWLASPGHCVNIMNPGFTETGAAYATNPDSDMGIYWTQDFGAPRQAAPAR